MPPPGRVALGRRRGRGVLVALLMAPAVVLMLALPDQGPATNELTSSTVIKDTALSPDWQPTARTTEDLAAIEADQDSTSQDQDQSQVLDLHVRANPAPGGGWQLPPIAGGGGAPAAVQAPKTLQQLQDLGKVTMDYMKMSRRALTQLLRRNNPAITDSDSSIRDVRQLTTGVPRQWSRQGPTHPTGDLNIFNGGGYLHLAGLPFGIGKAPLLPFEKYDIFSWNALPNSPNHDQPYVENLYDPGDRPTIYSLVDTDDPVASTGSPPWSDMTFLDYKSTGAAMNRLQYVSQEYIRDKETFEVMEWCISQRKGQNKAFRAPSTINGPPFDVKVEWAEYDPSTKHRLSFGPQEPEFVALMGTRVGQRVAKLLYMHKEAFGVKEVTGISIFRDARPMRGNYYTKVREPALVFEIGNVEKIADYVLPNAEAFENGFRGSSGAASGSSGAASGSGGAAGGSGSVPGGSGSAVGGRSGPASGSSGASGGSGGAPPGRNGGKSWAESGSGSGSKKDGKKDGKKPATD